jgi:hypothetical protein
VVVGPGQQQRRRETRPAHYERQLTALLRSAIEAGSLCFFLRTDDPSLRSTTNNANAARFHRNPDGPTGRERHQLDAVSRCCALWFAGTREPPLGLRVKAALADSALRGLDSGRAAAGAATTGGLQPPVCETRSIGRRARANSLPCRAVTVMSRIATPPRPSTTPHVQRSERRSGTAAWVTSREQTRVNSRER